MKNLPLLIGTIVGTLALIGVIAVLFSSDSQGTQQAATQVDQTVLMQNARNIYTPEVQEQVDPSQPQTDPSQTDQPSEPDSQDSQPAEIITVVEFSDFQCPACKASQPAVEQLKAAYPQNVQIVYRHFPLDSIHPNARLAAVASEAAASLNPATFWDYHDLLFENQQTWAPTRSRDELKNAFADYAVSLGLDRTQFLEKMEDDSLADLVNGDVALGTQLGVNSTPTFYVNGVKTSAPQLQTAVETILSN